MFRKLSLLSLVAFVGCGAPASTDTSAPASSDGGAAPAGSDSKPAGSGSKGSAAKADITVTQTAFNTTGAPVVEFEAPGMHCEFCAATIVGLLKDKPGVVDVMADAETKVVTVAVEEAEFEAEAVVEAIADAGFAEGPEDSAESSNS